MEDETEKCGQWRLRSLVFVSEHNSQGWGHGLFVFYPTKHWLHSTCVLKTETYSEAERRSDELIHFVEEKPASRLRHSYCSWLLSRSIMGENKWRKSHKIEPCSRGAIKIADEVSTEKAAVINTEISTIEEKSTGLPRGTSKGTLRTICHPQGSILQKSKFI